MRLILAFLLYLVLAGPSLAVDGVLEINQACAVQTGCFAGDTPGFPVTISGVAGKSYRFTSDLNGPIGSDANGLEIFSDRVSVDFNGFSLNRASIGSGSGDGITGAGTNGSFARFLSIKNGSLGGWVNRAIALAGAPGVRVENMIVAASIEVGEEAQVIGNRVSTLSTSSTNGITAGDRSLISDNVIRGMPQEGIRCGVGCVISDNSVSNNGSHGIDTRLGSTVSGNTVYSNGGIGMFIDSVSTVSGNTVSLNGVDGILAGTGTTISGNTVYRNTDDGIVCSDGCTVRENTVRRNSGFGLRLGTDSGYRENVVSFNTEGEITGSGVDAGANVVNGSVTPTP